ncbi:MAG: carboxymuconolactone decarboxylase family protein [Bacteroidaceae bacterium]|nr:carboxymuconolactone decarboxylase family protein [Bacteroidaceae bacterium]
MKKYLTALLAALLLAGQTKGEQSMNDRQRTLVTIGALAGKGDIDKLKTALHDGMDGGMTVSELKEALSQVYAYAGFPRSLNALGALQQVIKEREADGRRVEPGKEADPLPEDYDALQQGTEVQTQVTGVPFTYAFAPQTDYYLKAHLFGDIFARNNLSHADRELVTVGIISALPGCEAQLQAHLRGARNMGNSGEVVEKALRLALEVGGVTWPKGEPNTAFAQYFTGNSYLAVLDKSGLCNVTFEPGCRNNWHIHHGAVQVLICVSGRGWYQEWGKEPVELRPGMTIAVPEGVKHWHGAQRDSWMQHLTYHADVKEGASNDWLEPVSDEAYDKLTNY